MKYGVRSNNNYAIKNQWLYILIVSGMCWSVKDIYFCLMFIGVISKL